MIKTNKIVVVNLKTRNADTDSLEIRSNEESFLIRKLFSINLKIFKVAMNSS